MLAICMSLRRKDEADATFVNVVITDICENIRTGNSRVAGKLGNDTNLNIFPLKSLKAKKDEFMIYYNLVVLFVVLMLNMKRMNVLRYIGRLNQIAI